MAYQTRPVRTPRQHIVVTEGTVMRTGLARADAQDDFDRALRRARWATLAGWLHGRSSSRLLVLGNETIIIGAADRDVAVPIDHIVGSVEPTRCFDRHFRPTSRLPRTRFERIAADIYCGRGMDPVDLYQCGDQYYVLDGHHRVAVARALRQRWVLANITQVRRKSPGGSPGLGPDGAPPAADRAAAGLARRGRARELPKRRVRGCNLDCSSPQCRGVQGSPAYEVGPA